jgi:hypothetical protein
VDVADDAVKMSLSGGMVLRWSGPGTVPAIGFDRAGSSWSMCFRGDEAAFCETEEELRRYAATLMTPAEAECPPADAEVSCGNL